MYTNIPKPTGANYTKVTDYSVFYDQSNIAYDDVNTFYEGVNFTAYTNITKPTGASYTLISKPT